MAHCNVMICQRVTLSGDAEWPKVADAVIEAPFCPDNMLLAGFSGSFAQYPLPALAGRHDDGDVICLTRHAVNNPNPSMKSESVVL